MSFILDALKKAEAERQRQTGPTLLEVRVTAPRRRIPIWTLVIGALLGVNIVLLLVFVLRRPAASVVPSAAVTQTAPAVTTPPVQGPAPAPLPMVPAGTATAAAPGLVPQAPASAPLASTSALPAPVLSEPALNSPSAAAYPPMTSGSDVSARGGAEGGPGGDNPADYEPAVPAQGAAASARSSGGGNRPEPPSLQEVGGDLPDLRLDLHVYSTRPADRYALINMHRVREGDVLPEGPRVVAIAHDGVELSYRGTEFMLHPQ